MDEPKKVYSFRLSKDTKLALSIRAKEWGCSEAEAIERLLSGSPVSEQQSVAVQPNDKRANFEALKRAFSGTPVLEKPEVEEGPSFPFEVDVGDDTWTVWNRGTRYGYQIDGVGGGLLTEERAKQLWKLKK